MKVDVECSGELGENLEVGDIDLEDIWGIADDELELGEESRSDSGDPLVLVEGDFADERDVRNGGVEGSEVSDRVRDDDGGRLDVRVDSRVVVGRRV